ncbi:uncharacterized protein LOC142180786 [Nicotiana tabacum]|uniref:Uncharacterized protein LOC142180786 n=1 Tax=Nicotiana tabacum TaxID=4097 RepID=A0AC58UHJ3_TOBAC
MLANSIHSWPKLVRAFLAKWFPQSKKSELRDKIFFFKQVPGEHLLEAWDRFKLYLVRSPNHGFPDSILLEKFYMGLDPMNQSIAKNAAYGSFMDKSFAKVTQILDKMAKHNQAWNSEDTTGGIAYGSPSLTTMIKENQERDQVIAGLATNVNVLTKRFIENQTKKVNVAEDVQPISNEDFEEANYVNNSQGGYQRQQYQGSSSDSTLESMFERVLQNQEKSDTSMRNMTELVGSHTTSIQKLEMQMRDLSREQNLKQKGTLSSDTIANPKGSGSGPTSHIMAITTWCGKKEDPGAFTILCTIGTHDFVRALCDNGASINLMPLSIYKKEGLGMARPTSMRLQMADRSIKIPVGIVDDVLVKVEKFHLPADFVILDCAVDKEIPIILGRPFLATGRALMDSERNEIKFYANDEEVTFQASKGTKLPHEYESISVIDVVDEVEDAVEMKMDEQCLGEALIAILVNFNGKDMEGYMESVNALEGLGSYTYAPAKFSLNLENRGTPLAKPSIIEPSQLEFKPLPPHLRYKFIGSNDTLQVIVSSLLNDVQVEQLLEVLKEHRQDIGWTIADIRGVPAKICEHKIQLENDIKPSVDHQRRLNPSMQGVLDAVWFVQRSGYFSKMHDVHLLRHGGGFSRGFHGRLLGGIVLGHKISKHGIEVDRAKIEIISKLPPPTSVKGVRSFLGHAGFYRRFIKDFSKIANPMCKLLEKDAKFVFDEKCLKAFEELKQKLTTTPIFVTPDWSLPFELMCDANGVAIGAVLG